MSVMPAVRGIRQLIEPRNLPYRVLVSRVKRDPSAVRRKDDALELFDEMQLPRFRSFIREYVMHTDAPLTGEVVGGQLWMPPGPFVTYSAIVGPMFYFRKLVGLQRAASCSKAPHWRRPLAEKWLDRPPGASRTV